MTDKDKQKLLEAIYEKEGETMADGATAVFKVGIEKDNEENKAWYEGYEQGMRDAREVVQDFGRPTEEVLG